MQEKFYDTIVLWMSKRVTEAGSRSGASRDARPSPVFYVHDIF